MGAHVRRRARSNLARRRSPIGSDAGNTSIETVILYPVVIVVVFLIVQGVVFFHAQNVAMDVANSALQTTRVQYGSVEAGHAQAAAELARMGSVIRDSAVEVTRGLEVASVTVTGQAPSLVPGISGLRVTQTATGPVERYTELP